MSFIRKRFTYANVAVTAALLFAMSGGAYAASKFVITSKKQISPKVISALKGKAGAQGKTGPAGPAGATGPAGPVGPAGAPGKDGANGNDGSPGEPGPTGPKGATGSTGATGATGSPWTAGGELPSGQSESGTWSTVYTASAAEQPMSSPVSFTIPLKAEPEAHYIDENGEERFFNSGTDQLEERKSTVCKGNPEAPEATAGNVCFFATVEINATAYLLNKLFYTYFLEDTRFGVTLGIFSEAAGEVVAHGTWIATGT